MDYVLAEVADSKFYIITYYKQNHSCKRNDIYHFVKQHSKIYEPALKAHKRKRTLIKVDSTSGC